MKLKDYLQKIGKEMPEKKRNEAQSPADNFKCLIQLKNGLIMLGNEQEAMVYNQALDICGEIEVLEPLDEKMIDFEQFLMDKHAEGYVGTDDMMMDSFNEWVADLEVMEFIEYGDTYAKRLFRKFGKEKIDKEKIRKIIDKIDSKADTLYAPSDVLAEAIIKELEV